MNFEGVFSYYGEIDCLNYISDMRWAMVLELSSIYVDRLFISVE